MKRPSPLVQMTMALVALCSTLVLLGALLVDAMPDPRSHQRALRKVVTEALAAQVADLLRRDTPREVEKVMAAGVVRTEGLRSVAVRRADGTLVLQAGPHVQHWKPDADAGANPAQLTVPLSAEGRRWGVFEAAFAADESGIVMRLLQEPLLRLLLFIGGVGWLVFGLYMRRALQHLDPASVVPERVQGAFDAMAEGVVVLDARGRVMLSNKAFRAFDPALGDLQTGSELSALPWLAGSLPPDTALHPWTRAMSERAANAGTALEAGQGDDARRLVLNAAPIADPGGAVRGCMVTFNDMSALHRANEALHRAMDALEASKREMVDKNAELERLATRDPLTGTLNRRAFHAAFEPLMRRSQREGTGLACLMVDIDHFKAINDNHGHGVGDRAIQEVARKLQESARATDLVCRWGGEEFCVVVIGMNGQETLDFAQRMRARIERECGAGVREAEGLRVTVSIGVETNSPQVKTAAALIDRADKALYSAKRGGRNRVVMDLPLPHAALPPPAHLDAATGCLNSQGHAAALQTLREAARAQDRGLGCVMFGIDDSDALLALHGRQARVRAQRWLAGVVREAAPSSAAVARLDEHRLSVLLPGLGLEDCAAFAEHVRARAEQALAAVVAGDDTTGAGLPRRRVSVSAGVDSLPASAPGVAMLSERAEQALGRARRGGGNGVTLFVATRAAPQQTKGPR